MSLWNAIAKHITLASGEKFVPFPPITVSGGCVSAAVKLTDGSRQFFIKINKIHLLNMFAAEVEELKELARTDTFRVPKPICYGSNAGQAYLVLECLDFGQAPMNAAKQAGYLLANLHQEHNSDFGWQYDTFIGSTIQHNTWNADWIDFWRQHRLGFQLSLAARNGHGGRLQTRGEYLLDVFPALLDHTPSPSLLHGDFWRGNLNYGQDGFPIIFDPATYYGDKEADLAMTELFGGFPGEFYDAYREIWPLLPGYPVRKTFYNLYHVLNHLNLFGGGYLGQARGMIDRVLAELGH
ncbi:hypothetical protein TI03_00620 [Achromatium sp. WMS1]|nr:hypothetical protein TI03_00620 [Achromatium sp. WMS1]